MTTATCVALNKEDDCEELLAFKHYRDTVLIYESDGTELIREYYRIAPRIVEAIESNENSKQLYQKLWNDYIVEGYEYLLKNDMMKAKETYINMVLSLCKKYDVVIV
ncbi:MAG: CFI-box-CTERM domain-containing protein [Clostridium sp.]|uniref:CFI-box-CTERM domain-containing protein n=1 Tax=Clostridium sp. TaxID=1506 RepID=UPI00290E36FE|nr:CFI-box-CTERM domain-containing protein [Clostridium sp.]MDU5111877.1 CFI-box-CTERM domain-containing protein [Clostridium sp.]